MTASCRKAIDVAAAEERVPERLLGLLAGPAAWMAERVTFDEAPPDRFLSAADIAGTDRLRPVLERYGETYPGGPKRAAVSLWSQYYAGLLVPPVVAMQLAGGLSVDLSPETTGMVLDDGGCPVALRLGGGPPRPDGELDAFESYARLIDHLRPVVAVLAAEAELSPRLIWANAATMFEWIVDEAEKTGLVDPRRLAKARAILTCRAAPDGCRNPLFEPTRAVDANGTRLRKLCCQRLDLPGVSACATCPKRQDM